ncbi:MAG: orotidine-5'-phosphate decarboxylase [Alphaproteobacteria bacterium]|nr:orotidine-5'-phosphate decarboxylase [Alphaproteobacteria bacterium]
MATRSAGTRLLCAIDTADLAGATGLARDLVGMVGGIKLGLEFFAAHGADGVRSVADSGQPVFLDLKYNDIPNTVAGAVRSAARFKPFMMTVHVTGGPAMLRGAVAAAFRVADQMGSRPKIIGVTVLTSFDEDDLAAVGMQPPIADQVRRLADLAQGCGLDGVVASAHEIKALRAQCGPDFALVVPGIRPAWSLADDQKRVIGPAEALRNGADFLVVGRPITSASDPVTAAKRVVEEMAMAT